MDTVESSRIIKSHLKEIISRDLDSNISLESIKDDISLYEDGLGLDSISIVKFVVAIEKKFEISFDDTDISADNFSTLNNLTDFLSKKIQQK